MINTPIALIFFNRPEKLEKVFEQIEKIKPKTLFLIQDGPRNSNLEYDSNKIQECRKIVEKINWDCKVYKNYSETNLGCGLRPYTGIKWVFEYVEDVIILEDDCVPDLSFFGFCEQLLKKYKKTDNVYLISGMNLLEKSPTDTSYFFSKACTIGAWATWKRVWDKYDFEIKDFDNETIKSNIRWEIGFKNVIESKFAAWDLTREKIKNNEKISWWDYQFHFSLYLNSGLGIVPSVNLIENIGYGEGATNASSKKKFKHFNLKSNSLDLELKHPKNIACSWNFDKELYLSQCKKISKIRRILGKVKRTLKRKLGIR